jgi:hypothetical protein
MNVKYRNKISKWQMGFNSAFKGLNPTSGAIISKKFITTDLVQRDPIMTPLQTYFVLHLFIYFQTGGIGLDLNGS